MAMVFEREFDSIDFSKLLKLCIVHDLGEAINGDVSAVDQPPDVDKSNRERNDSITLIEPLDEARRNEFMSLWEEYESGSSPEAQLVKGLDKLETIIPHNQGRNPLDFDYAFNLSYGQKHTSTHPLLAALRRLVDEDTRRHLIASR